MTANITAKADASASTMSRAVDWLRQGAATSTFAAASAAAAAAAATAAATAAAAASAPTSDAAASAPAAAATTASAAEAAAAVAATTASAAASTAESAPAWLTLIGDVAPLVRFLGRGTLAGSCDLSCCDSSWSHPRWKD